MAIVPKHVNKWSKLRVKCVIYRFVSLLELIDVTFNIPSTPFGHRVRIFFLF